MTCSYKRFGHILSGLSRRGYGKSVLIKMITGFTCIWISVPVSNPKCILSRMKDDI
jgi:hypothetical protein